MSAANNWHESTDKAADIQLKQHFLALSQCLGIYLDTKFTILPLVFPFKQTQTVYFAIHTLIPTL